MMATSGSSSVRPSTCKAIEGCNLPIDVVLQSSDGKLLGAHSKNLEWFAEGFPASGSTLSSEIVPLTDKKDALLLFLKFTHNHPAPDLSDLSIDDLLDFAEVANKYCNYFALATCRQPMRALAQQSPDNALRILRFKAIHRDLEGIDSVANRTMDIPMLEVLRVFGSDHTHEFTVWLQYQNKRRETNTSQFYARLRSNTYGCLNGGTCPNANMLIAKHKPIMETEIPSIQKFDSTFNSQTPCSQPNCRAFQTWRESVRAELQKIPTWQQFMAW